MLIGKIANRILFIIIFCQASSISSLAYSESSSGSFLKDKKIDYKTISDKREKELQEKKETLKGKNSFKPVSAKLNARASMNLNSAKDLSNIYIPETIGKVMEAYENPDSKKLVAYVQDLHCNPEASFNLANILEILIKDYDLNLVCSEGAEGEVDTSAVSGFPDPVAKEKVAKLFVNSGELTGEEYLSITKYPKLPIWGIEKKDIYLENIFEFNKIMEFNQDSMAFINKTNDVLKNLKPKIYTPKILELDNKYIEYEEVKLDAISYLDYLIKLNPRANNYKNISLFMETLSIEKQMDQKKIVNQSQDLLNSLMSVLKPENNKLEIETLVNKTSLFKDRKISPYSFYSYLSELAMKYLKDKVSGYSNLFEYSGYLNKLNSLNSAALYQEIDELTYETMDLLSDNSDQKTLTKALRDINILQKLFNLEVSNEEYSYYLERKNEFKTSFFKTVITELMVNAGLPNHADYIDFNPVLIDSHLPELEHFYDISYKRDIEMSKNAMKKIEEINSKVSAIVTGGFHTQGITKALKENGYSYVVISPYAKTGIDEENYRFLLSGKRKSIEDLISQMDNEKK